MKTEYDTFEKVILWIAAIVIAIVIIGNIAQKLGWIK